MRLREGESGADRLRFAADKPALIILDVKLPDLSGFEVCRRIKEDPATAGIPILHISTTFREIEDRIQGLEGGADGYLTDVLEPLEIVATVKALLRARRAEEAAQISSRQWQVTFDAINDGVVLLDRGGRALQINCAMEKILGKSWNELSHHTIHDFLPIQQTPEDSPFLRMLNSSQRETTELRLGDRWLGVTVDPVRDSAGVIKGGLCISSDITERRRLEEELRRCASELAAADRRKDEFLAMLAHELRNPLAPIANALEAIRLNRSDPSAFEDALKIAGRQVRAHGPPLGGLAGCFAVHTRQRAASPAGCRSDDGPQASDRDVAPHDSSGRPRTRDFTSRISALAGRRSDPALAGRRESPE